MIFKNAEVIGSVDPEAYHRPTAERGDLSLAMSNSSLKEFLSCPHRWRAGYKQEPTESLSWGSLVDTLLLDTETFDKKYIVTPETYLDAKGVEKPWNWNGKFCKEWREENSDKTCIKPDKMAEAEQAVATINRDPDIKEILQASQFQVMVVAEYHDEQTGIIVPVKCLIDAVPPEDMLIDFKTCSSANIHPFTRQVHQYGYHKQGAFYLDMWNCARPDDKRDEFRLILQENFAPWEVGRRILSDEFLTMGRGKYEYALRLYCQCLVTGVWPSYDDMDDVDAIDGWTMIQPEAWML